MKSGRRFFLFFDLLQFRDDSRQRRLKKYQCPVWDFYGIMGELGSSRTWMTKGLMQSDMVHFTSVGYHLKASLFEDAWEKWLQQMELRNR